MLQVAINAPAGNAWDFSFFEEFGLRADLLPYGSGNATILNVSDLEGNDLFGAVVDSVMLTADLSTAYGSTRQGRSIVAAVITLAKRYKGKLVLGDELTTFSEAWATMVRKSDEDPSIRSLLEKHGVLPVDVLAKLKRGSAVF